MTEENPPAAELEAIAKVVGQFEHAQQNELPEQFIALFRADAIWTTAHGKLLLGRDEIAAFTRRVLPGAMKEATAAYDVAHVVFIRPDVAAVKVRQRPITHGGEPIAGRNEGTPMLVMAKDNGAWRIVAAQNTEVL